MSRARYDNKSFEKMSFFFVEVVVTLVCMSAYFSFSLLLIVKRLLLPDGAAENVQAG